MMNYQRVCLYCGRSNNIAAYSCNCTGEGWAEQYRMMDIKMELDDNRSSLIDSFNNYTFHSPEGLLQYKGLPLQHILTDIDEAPGLTPLYELSNFSIDSGCNLFLKDEGANPSGCFKDRETVMCLLHSEYQGLRKAVIYSSGNAAASAAFYSRNANRKLLSFVAGDTYPEKINYIQNRGIDVIVIGDNRTNFETGYRLFSEMSEQAIFAANGYDNWSVRNPFRVQGDKTTALEIIKQLSAGEPGTMVPDYVIVPSANGSCLAGIWKGFRELKKNGIVSTLPVMIATGIKNANPVSRAVRLRQTDLPVRCDLDEVDSRDREVGSVIVAEEGYDSMQAARAVLESGGFEMELHAPDIKNALVNFLELEESLALKHNLLPEPAALTALAAVGKMREKISLSPSDVVVSISTGDGLKAGNQLLSLLADRPVLQEKVNRITGKKVESCRPVFAKRGSKIDAEPNKKALIQSFLKLQRQPA